MNKHDLGHGLHAEAFTRESLEFPGQYTLTIALPCEGNVDDDLLHPLLRSSSALLGAALNEHWGFGLNRGLQRCVVLRESAAVSIELAEATEADAIRLLREVVRENAGETVKEPAVTHTVSVGAGLCATFTFNSNYVAVDLPAQLNGDLFPALQDDSITLLGEKLSHYWGNPLEFRTRHCAPPKSPKEFMDDVVKTLREVTAKNAPEPTSDLWPPPPQEYDIGGGLTARVEFVEAESGGCNPYVSLPAGSDGWLHPWLVDNSQSLLGYFLGSGWGEKDDKWRRVGSIWSVRRTDDTGDVRLFVDQVVRVLRGVVQHNLEKLGPKPYEETTCDVGAGLSVRVIEDRWPHEDSFRLELPTAGKGWVHLHSTLVNDNVLLLGEALSFNWGQYLNDYRFRSRTVQKGQLPVAISEAIETLRAVVRKNPGLVEPEEAL